MKTRSALPHANVNHRLVRFLDRSLAGQIRFTNQFTSFSPFGSNVGLGFSETAGLDRLYIHHNRHTSPIGQPFLCWNLGGQPLKGKTDSSPFAVRQDGRRDDLEWDGQILFWDQDAWMLVFCFQNHSAKAQELNLRLQPFHECAKNLRIVTNQGRHTVLTTSEMATTDRRDPDWFFLFTTGIRYEPDCWDRIETRCENPKLCNETRPYQIVFHRNLRQGQRGRFRLWFSAGVMKDGARLPAKRLKRTVPSVNEALDRTQWWWSANVRLPTVPTASGKENRLLARAVSVLMFNACRASGKLKGGVAIYPNRGRYATHYFWDTFFHNLALETTNCQWARNGIELLIRNAEPDGKIPAFVCATWNRSGASQCPLLGWAVQRCFEKNRDFALARQALPVLERNCRWWLTVRDPHHKGLMLCDNPFEIWDDTPRLDDGPIYPADSNSYLAIQMEACMVLAEALGYSRRARHWRDKRRTLVQRMVNLLYCPRDNLFYDRLIEPDRLLRLKTPATFMPLLLPDLPLPTEKRQRMIEDYLLSPKHFCGKIPFPVVAYRERKYESHQWWRGPMWPPISYLLLEVLRRNGWEKEYRRLLNVVLNLLARDGTLHELFDSRTGKGLGSPEQGWTAAVYIALWIDRESTSHGGNVL